MTDGTSAWVDEAEDWEDPTWAFTVPRRVRLRLWIRNDINRLTRMVAWTSRKA